MRPFKRRLTDHITTRLYRAPEVILLEKHYHKSIDIWAAGVVVADLFRYISMTEEERLEKSPQIFSSNHCFPLSP
jgi:mitogen-activated protein kinase 1/3